MAARDIRRERAESSHGASGGQLANGPPRIKLEGMRTLTAIIYPGETGRWLVAFNPETGTTTQGKTVEQALQNLKEAVKLYLEEQPAPARPGAILTTFEVEHA
jgi:predicted RNase H-like HicB family nuclease